MHGEGLGGAQRLDLSEDCRDGPSRDPRVLDRPIHGECLAGARLAVGEDADVVAVQDGGDEGVDVGEDVFLRAWVVDTVELKLTPPDASCQQG